MSVKYIPVQWNNVKWKYNFILLTAVFGYITLFLVFGKNMQTLEGTINFQILAARAFGSLAFFMISFILCIGPLVRLDNRFLPLLYNRRHFGVITFFVAVTHAGYVMNWYYGFSAINKFEAMLFANTSFTQILGFPFEIFGICALLCLAILAFTSHDFWMKFLTPPIWKKIHMSIYVAYIFIVAHVALGAMQSHQHSAFTIAFVVAAVGVAVLHLAAFYRENQVMHEKTNKKGWVKAAKLTDMKDGFANITLLENGDRVAVFLADGKLSAISNACAHQNGPLGEGKIIRCLVTCPWHGFQYNITNGQSPAPFTEQIPTYNLEIRGKNIWIDANANKPGTYVKPIKMPKMPKIAQTQKQGEK